MKKSKFLPLLILSFIFISLEIQAVPHPEYIEWRAQPKGFVISLYKGILGEVTQNQITIDELVSKISFDPWSRLELFWMFINSKEYSNSSWALQKKENQVYYEYMTSGNSFKNRYYVAKKPSGADMSIKGSYTFGVAMAVRDYYATYDPNSLEYGQVRILSTPDNLSANRVTDRGGNTYSTIKIGNQVWMAENLAYKIPGKEITNNIQWKNNSTYDGWSYYNNNKTNGILYQWEAAKKVCPIGWHLPSDEEWKQLEIFLGMNQGQANGKEWRGTDEGSKLKNSYGFRALPGGRRDMNGTFIYDGIIGFWWSSKDVYYRAIRFPSDVILRDNNWSKKSGMSVRCVKN